MVTVYEYAVLSLLTYEENQFQLLPGWQVLDQFEYNDYGYKGIAFKNNQNEIVIAHRGTKKDLTSNIYQDYFLVKKEMPPGHYQAEMFSKGVRESQKNGNIEYNITETGHSLGAFYAEVNSVKFKSKAVTFECPGSKELIDGLAKKLNVNDYSNLITCYLASPNFINTLNGHIGKLIRVFVPHVDKNSGNINTLFDLTKAFLQNNAFNFIAKVGLFSDFINYDATLHNIDNMVSVFDKNFGVPFLQREVKKWPSFNDYVQKKTDYKNMNIMEYIKEHFNLIIPLQKINIRYEEFSTTTPNLIYGNFIFPEIPEECDDNKISLFFCGLIRQYRFFYNDKVVKGLSELIITSKYSEKQKDIFLNVLQSIPEQDEKTQTNNFPPKNPTLNSTQAVPDEQFLNFWDVINKSDKSNMKQEIEKKFQFIPFETVVEFMKFKNKKDGNTLLHYIAKLGIVDAGEELIKYGSDVNSKNNDGDTPLHLACINHYEFCELLLKNGALVDAVNNNKLTPLFLVYDNDRIIDLLIRARATFTLRSTSDKSILYYILNSNWAAKLQLVFLGIIKYITSILSFLNHNQINVNAKQVFIKKYLTSELKNISRHAWNEFVYAIKNHQDLILTELKEDVIEMIFNCVDNNGSLLHYAVQYHNKSALECLLQNGFNVNITDSNGQTALHMAILKGYSDIIVSLVAFKANVNAQDFNGDTPLHLVRYNNEQIISLLIENGADITLINRTKTTVLYGLTRDTFAWRLDYILLGYIRYIKNMISKQTEDNNLKIVISENNLDGVNNGVWKGLKEQLIKASTPQQLKVYIEKNIQSSVYKSTFNHKSSSDNGNTLLHYAAISNHIDGAKILLEHVDCNVANQNGETPLHLAVNNNKIEFAKYLLEQKKINVNAKTKKNETPIFFATKVDIIDILMENGCDITIRNSSGYSCLWAFTESWFAWKIDHILLKAFEKLLKDVEFYVETKTCKS